MQNLTYCRPPLYFTCFPNQLSQTSLNYRHYRNFAIGPSRWWSIEAVSATETILSECIKSVAKIGTKSHFWNF